MRLRDRAERHAAQAEQRQAADRLDIIAVEAELAAAGVRASRSVLKRWAAQGVRDFKAQAKRAQISGRTA